MKPRFYDETDRDYFPNLIELYGELAFINTEGSA